MHYILNYYKNGNKLTWVRRKTDTNLKTQLHITEHVRFSSRTAESKLGYIIAKFRMCGDDWLSFDTSSKKNERLIWLWHFLKRSNALHIHIHTGTQNGRINEQPRDREGRETQIYRSVNYETTCLMTRPDPTRCKFSTRGWSFKPSPWLPYHCHSSRTALISASSTRHPLIDFPRTFCPTLPFPHPDTGTHFSVIRYLFLIFPPPFLLHLLAFCCTVLTKGLLTKQLLIYLIFWQYHSFVLSSFYLKNKWIYLSSYIMKSEMGFKNLSRFFFSTSAKFQKHD